MTPCAFNLEDLAIALILGSSLISKRRRRMGNDLATLRVYPLGSQNEIIIK